MSMKKVVALILSVLPSLLIILLRPLGFSLYQSVVMGGLILAIIWWTSDLVPNAITSSFLIVVLLIFGQTPIPKVLNFVFSQNLFFVCASFLLARGISNSGLVEKYVNRVVARLCRTTRSLLIIASILNLLLAFIIPQAIPRAVILATIFTSIMDQTHVRSETRAVVLFGIFVECSIISRAFLNSDIMVNYAALQFGKLDLSQMQWAAWMALPTIITACITTGAFLIVFRKDLREKITIAPLSPVENHTKIENVTLALFSLIVFLWLTESLHGISPAYIALAGAAMMFLLRILQPKDLGAINVNIVISLTAQFAIGAVLSNNGIATIIGDSVRGLMPSPSHPGYLLALMLLIVVLHFFVGSLVTSLAVCIPIILSLTAGVLPPNVAVLFTLVVVSFQYVFPFQHITVMLGHSAGYFKTRHTFKFALPLLIITFLCTLFIFLPWWNLLGAQ